MGSGEHMRVLAYLLSVARLAGAIGQFSGCKDKEQIGTDPLRAIPEDALVVIILDLQSMFSTIRGELLPATPEERQWFFKGMLKQAERLRNSTGIDIEKATPTNIRPPPTGAITTSASARSVLTAPPPGNWRSATGWGPIGPIASSEACVQSTCGIWR